jgi:predicted transcriptional regulator
LERLTVADAAKLLGVTEAAIRQRIRRETIQFEKAEGRTYVYVDPNATRREHVDNESRDELRDSLLFETMQARIDSLEHQLEEERRASAETRRLLAASLERIPAIEAPEEPPPEPRQYPETPFEKATKGKPPPGDTEQPRASEAREPWWQRWFGG